MQAPITEREWFTREEVCQFLQIGPTKLWELTSSGQIPVSRIGRLVRIHRADIDAFMRESRECVPR